MMDFDKLNAVIDRAEEFWGGLPDDRFAHKIDITYANEVFDIDFDAWLAADTYDFLHDFAGIYKNIDREYINNHHKATLKCFNYFVPRFARMQ